MQTFLPYPDFKKSAKILDYKRLGKQRVEGMTILNILNGFSIKEGWKNHPATKMWKGHRGALKKYCQTMINEWVARGYKNTIDLSKFADDEQTMPAWFGNNDFHIAHQSNLIRKQLETEAKGNTTVNYKELFNVPSNLPYIWGVK